MSTYLHTLIIQCRLNKEDARYDIYEGFYCFAKSVCQEYDLEETDQIEIIKSGFNKAFKYIHDFNVNSKVLLKDFKIWLRKMIIFAIIGYFRSNLQFSYILSDSFIKFREPEYSSGNFPGLTQENIKSAILKLPPASRIVINLKLLQGFNENDFVKCLEISSGNAHVLINDATENLKHVLRA